jgi:hypothetical protein
MPLSNPHYFCRVSEDMAGCQGIPWCRQTWYQLLSPSEPIPWHGPMWKWWAGRTGIPRPDHSNPCSNKIIMLAQCRMQHLAGLLVSADQISIGRLSDRSRLLTGVAISPAGEKLGCTLAESVWICGSGCISNVWRYRRRVVVWIFIPCILYTITITVRILRVQDQGPPSWIIPIHYATTLYWLGPRGLDSIPVRLFTSGDRVILSASLLESLSSLPHFLPVSTIS